ncbi:YhgE/Pip domain-containing protein [Clostridium oryzae]|uniref:ABC-2 family transporter protein n=1 Tax=Clostridium oryzae TaxID=1450648 RepID=A0A1V4IX01_9CLOT|nr:YhgE/Pip domain-containing protein [Clostridium oryzae]OPJ64578.1 ABC-2 family transporter protein [Clostridium oryzae]
MNALKIAARDLSRVFKNKYVMVSVIAITIVPLLYSLLYLAAFWDPYSRLSTVPIAVVNEDKGTENDGQVNYGEKMVKELKKNDDLGWKFVTYEKAKEGVYNKSVNEKNSYYGMFVIPKNFSEKVVSAKNGKPQHPTITFVENQKKNFIQTQIDGKLMVELQKKVAKTITKEYTKVAFDSLYDVKDGMKAAANGSKKLKNGINSAQDGDDKLNSGLINADDGAKNLGNGIDKLNNGSRTAASGAWQLNSGIKQFMDLALTPASKGISSLNGGLNNQLLPAMKKIKDGSASLADGLYKAGGGADKLLKGSDSLSEAVMKENGLSDGALTLTKSGNKLTKAATKLSQGAKKIAIGIPALSGGASEVSDGVNEYITSVQQSQKTLSDAVNSYFMPYLQSHKLVFADDNIQKFIQVLKTVNENASSKETIQKVNELRDGAASEAKYIKTLETGTKDFTAGVEQYAKGASEYAAGATKFANGAGQYASGASNYASGAVKLAAGLKPAIKGAVALKDGSNKLYIGMNGDFKNGLLKLDNSMPKVKSSANKIYSASGKLAKGIDTISSGTDKLNSGSKLLITGLDKLKDGSSDLSNGLNDLSDGSSKLNNKLEKGYNKIDGKLINSSSVMSKFISDPLHMKKVALNPIPNYGKGFAPYFIALSLWVGAIMMFFVIKDDVDDDLKGSAVSIVFGKYITFTLLGILQALVVSTVVLSLGLHPYSLGMYYLTNIYMAMVFVAIVQTLIFLLGDGGRIIALALLILQLTSCAGTFALEVVPKFFKVLNPLMPFTYTVAASREVIAGINWPTLFQNYLVLAVFMVVFLVFQVMFKIPAERLIKKVERERAA